MVIEEIRKYNKQLIAKYPWLLPRNRWTGEVVEDYDYSYTELDDMPDGWRAAFGEQMCEEIQQALNMMEPYQAADFRIVQIKEKYGCYDDETEVLTKNGWKFFKDITYNDEIATLKEDGETLIYQKPEDIICYNYQGTMYHLENRGISLRVTPNHQLYVSKGSYYYHKKNNKKRTYSYEFATPDKYFGKDKRFKKGAIWVGANPYGDTFTIPGYIRIDSKPYKREYHYPDFIVDLKCFLRFLGFYVAEGCTSIVKDNSNHIREITIAYNKFDEEELVTTLINDIGIEPKCHQPGIKHFSNCTLGYWLRDNCGHLAPNKKVPDFIKELPPELIKIFLEYLFIGDGHKNPTSNVLTTTSKQLCDDVCELLLKAGYSFRYTTRQPRTGSYIKGKHLTYEINWLKLTEIEIDNSKAKQTKSFVETYEEYNGQVYCVTVPSHILYVRRNGKGVWCGNSLRFYTNWVTDAINNVIYKYEKLSEHTCISCGAPATKMSTGWISPWCDKCASKIQEKFVPLNPDKGILDNI